MDNTTLKIDTNPNGMELEEQFSALHKRLQENGDGTDVVAVGSDAVLQFYINDSKKVLNASKDQLPIVLTGILNRINEIQHPKLYPLYHTLISFADINYQQSLTITKMRQEETTFTVSNQDCNFVQPNHINYVNEPLAEIDNLQEEAKALAEPNKKIEFEFEGSLVYVCNGVRDRIFRYWYLHRDRHVALGYSNRMIAKEMNAELGVTVDYASKIISQINRWFVNPTNMSWLSGDYIMRTQMLFSYRGYSYLQLNYCNQPPSRQQIITLGQQLQVNTRQQEEE